MVIVVRGTYQLHGNWAITNLTDSTVIPVYVINKWNVQVWWASLKSQKWIYILILVGKKSKLKKKCLIWKLE